MDTKLSCTLYMETAWIDEQSECVGVYVHFTGPKLSKTYLSSACLMSWLKL